MLASIIWFHKNWGTCNIELRCETFRNKMLQPVRFQLYFVYLLTVIRYSYKRIPPVVVPIGTPLSLLFCVTVLFYLLSDSYSYRGYTAHSVWVRSNTTFVRIVMHIIHFESWLSKVGRTISTGTNGIFSNSYCLLQASIASGSLSSGMIKSSSLTEKYNKKYK